MESLYSFEEARRQWTRVPVDDFDYLSADDLLILSPSQIRDMVGLAGYFRYATNQWRNRDNKLVDFMGLDRVKGKTVVDFGCGIGLDSVTFARYGASCILADINPKTLLAAQHVVIGCAGVLPARLIVVSGQYPFFQLEQGCDLFWSLGVLHHTPLMGDILRRACEVLRSGGECRILVYSDRRWVKMMQEPVSREPISEHPRFVEYVRKCDTVGYYADWYDEEKLGQLVEPFGKVVRCEYVSDDQFLAAVIVPK